MTKKSREARQTKKRAKADSEPESDDGSSVPRVSDADEDARPYLVDGTEPESPAASDEADNSQPSKPKKAKQKSGKKKNNAQQDVPALSEQAETQSQPGIVYLQQWKSNRASWKFQKLRQMWLLKNMYTSSVVDLEHFTILLEYLEKMQGQARQRCIQEAQTLVESDQGVDPVKMERAKNVLQLLVE